MHAHYQFVSPDYLQTIGVPLLAGRWLTTADHFDAPKVVLVSRALAEQYWPSLQASLGERIYTFGNAGVIDNKMTVVGVVGDLKDSPTDAKPPAAMYQPFLQNPSFGNFVALRATADPAATIKSARKVAEDMGNDLSIQEVRPLEQVVAAAIAVQRFAMQITGLFALIALVLALIGIHGVMSFAAARRALEISIREALGAERLDILGLLLSQGLRLIAAGLALGVLAAAALTRFLSGILYQVSPTDPLTFVAVAAVVAGVATLACLRPALKRRQARLFQAPSSISQAGVR
jgi:putative ABC transport system permease protein